MGTSIVGVEAVLFEELRSINEGGEIVDIRNVYGVTVTFKPDVELSDAAEFNVSITR